MVRLQGDQPFVGQVLQGLADGDPADAEVGGQLLLRQDGAGLEFTRKDGLAQLERDRFGDGAGDERGFGRRLHGGILDPIARQQCAEKP